MPAVDRETRQVLLAEKDRVALSPDGHGGTLPPWPPPGRRRRAASTRCASAASARSSTSRSTTRWSQIADPAFLGLHRQADAEMSFKVIEKLAPDEKLGRGRHASTAAPR